MKKIILLLLIITILSTLNITAFATDKTEIEFSVGDETLLINKTPVTVVKPYVVGEGVTLVPVRVITEAFGAKVGWVEETSTVTLEYEDINIVLQLGNIIATVNEKEETLLSAPELTNSSTMVPLRFISEKFGATVSYDEATERITVVKENNKETLKYVNDKLGFSMKIPADLKLSSYSTDNIIRFYSDDEYDEKYMLTLEILRKEMWEDVENIINKHRDRNGLYIRETSIKKLDKVSKTEYKDISAYEYSYELYYSEGNIFGRVTGFEKDDIVYVFESHGISEKMLKNIYESLDVSNIDKSKTVDFKFNKENKTFVYDNSLTDVRITLPKTYIKSDKISYERYDNIYSIIYTDNVKPLEYIEYVRAPGEVVFMGMIINKKAGPGHFMASDFVNDTRIKEEYKGKLISHGEYKDVLFDNSVSYVEIDYVIKENGKKIYCEEYMKLEDETEYRFVIKYPELYYSDEVKQEIYNALGRI